MSLSRYVTIRVESGKHYVCRTPDNEADRSHWDYEIICEQPNHEKARKLRDELRKGQ